MKLFKVERPIPAPSESFKLMVCAAENDQDARIISPFVPNFMDYYLNDDRSILWWGCSLSDLTVTYIGEAAEGIEEGVICADFNAG